MVKLNQEKIKENIKKKVEEKLQNFMNRKQLTVVDLCTYANFVGCKADELLEGAIIEDEQEH